MNGVRTRPRSQPPPHARGRAAGGRLSRTQLQELEAELLAERARLERSLDGASTLGDEAPAAGPRVGSLVPGDADGGLGVALHGRAQARRDAIDAALQRLADGTYGRCTGCGGQIPFGRLIVMPESERCVACGPLA